MASYCITSSHVTILYHVTHNVFHNFNNRVRKERDENEKKKFGICQKSCFPWLIVRLMISALDSNITVSNQNSGQVIALA